MKVFCIHCKWISRPVIGDTKCKHSDNLTGYVVKSRIFMKDCSSLNKLGMCELYERSWWKIWGTPTQKIKVPKDRHPGGPIRP